MERQLATIRRINAIEAIPGADNIVCLTIDGWKLVSQKDNFKPDDLAVYFEIDSFLPVREEFEFLRSRCYKNTPNLGEGFRLKTIKLRGQISQGLALPLADLFKFNEGTNEFFIEVIDEGGYWRRTVVKEGDDVTALLKVQKYEKPETGPGSSFGPSSSRGNFPSFIRKTDQERAQNCLGSIKHWIYNTKESIFFTEHPGELGSNETLFQNEGGWIKTILLDNPSEVVDERCRFEATLKLDGSSMTVYYNDGEVGVCSRNLNVKRHDENKFWKTALDAGLVGMLAHYGKNIALQGELMGPGVQNNRENLEKNRFYLFDVWDIDEQRYWTPHERNNSLLLDNLLYNNPLANHYMMKVPSLGEYVITKDTNIDTLLQYAEQPSINHKVAEGVVFKSYSKDGRSFKIISNAFLLNEKD